MQSFMTDVAGLYGAVRWVWQASRVSHMPADAVTWWNSQVAKDGLHGKNMILSLCWNNDSDLSSQHLTVAINLLLG